MAGAVPAVADQTVNPAEALPPGAVIVQQSRLRIERVAAVVLGIAFLGLVAVNLTQAPSETTETPTRRFSFSQEGLGAPSISPDSRYIAFAVGTRPESSLWLRAIGTETAREIRGTEGARPDLGWSPDSQAIVFATTTEIKRVGIDGGDPITLGDLQGSGPAGFLGVSWSPDGERIVFSSTGVLREIPARGGESQVLVDRDLGAVRQPHFLPTDSGPEALVYDLGAETGRQIWVLNLETGERSEVGPGSAPVYSQDGYLIHGEVGEPGLRAVPFSLASLEPTGEAFPIAEDGQSASVARDGTLVFLDGNAASVPGALVWRNRAGELVETIGQPQAGMSNPALSPDGQRIAVAASESGNRDIWIHDLVRSTKTRLTFDEGNEDRPTWSPSGGEITYRAGRGLMNKAADGTGEAVVLVEAVGGLYSPEWSQDGRYLAYTELNREAGSGVINSDIHYVELQTDGEVSAPVTFLSPLAIAAGLEFSPDGRFLAYSSNESGRREVYVLPFPDGAGKRQVSVNGGAQVRWRSNGKELYYVEGATLMAVPVSTEPTFTLG